MGTKPSGRRACARHFRKSAIASRANNYCRLGDQVRRGVTAAAWIPARAHVFGICSSSGHGQLAQFRIAPHELRHGIDREPQHVIRDQHLAVAMRTGANADGRNPQIGGDELRHGLRNGFQHHGKRSGCFERQRISPKARGILVATGLLAESAKLVHGLRQESQVPHHRNSGGDQTRCRLDGRSTAFDLHGRCAALLHQAPRMAQRFFWVDLVGHKGQVGHQQRASHTAAHGPRVMHHVVQGHRQRGFVSQYDHAERIAHQQHVDSRAVQQPGHGVVVGRQHGDLFAALLLGFQIGCADPLRISHAALLSVEGL